MLLNAKIVESSPRKSNMKFDFSRKEFDDIVSKCMLNEELTKILEYRIKNYSITKISIMMNMSESSVNRRIKQIKKKIMKII